ncbi:hypothetical protein [Paraburkholderia sp. UCT2]|uniref:hypothetical protein n=1 Tax=Paraburkholderia sp. UCT2 TaxID=2615208 RepID=UPI001655C693|nr:hypothetical protein [Paraburkholderia sp. UCT2]MBC8728277.1 hypothetical protein [Paraburkholderia sp. UCT2]
MSESLMGTLIGSLVLVIAAISMVSHYRREHRREHRRAQSDFSRSRIHPKVEIHKRSLKTARPK